MKVLIIDDDFRVRRTVIDMLEMDGFEVLEAETGREGISLAVESQPDLVLCDVLMPEMNGYDVAETLRSNPKTKMIPFLFLTAHSFRGEFAPSLNLGPDDFVSKPVTGKVLKQAIMAKVYGKSYLRESRMSTILPSIQIDPVITGDTAGKLRDILALSEYMLRFSTLLDKDEMLEVAREIHEAAWRLSDTLAEDKQA